MNSTGDASIYHHTTAQNMKEKISSPKVEIKDYKIWYYGRHVGDINVVIESKNFPFIRQMALGVLTGSGVAFSSTTFLVENNTGGFFDNIKKGLPKQMQEIYDYFQELKKRDLSKTGHKRVSISKAGKILKGMSEFLISLSNKS